METQTIDPERQKKAKVYARLSRRLMLVDLGLTTVYILAWLFTGWSAGLKAALLQMTSNPWLLVVGYALIFGAILFVIDLVVLVMGLK